MIWFDRYSIKQTGQYILISVDTLARINKINTQDTKILRSQKIMADFARYYDRCSWNYRWFKLIYHCFMQSYGLLCVLHLCFPNFPEQLESCRPSLRLVLFQRNYPLHPTNQSTTTITPQYLQQTDAPLRV